MKRFISDVALDLLVGIIFLKLMELIREIDTFSFGVGAAIVLIWLLLDAIRGEK